MRGHIRRHGGLQGACFFLLPLFVFFEFLPSSYAQEFTTSPTWREALGAKIIGEPTSQASSVVILCDDGTVRCFSYTGKALWTFDTRSKLLPFVSRAPDGSTYVMSQERFLIALNRAGRKLWSIRLAAPLQGPIQFGWDGRLFIPLPDRVLCFTPGGFQLWERKLPFPLREALVPDSQGGVLGMTEGAILIRLSALGRLEQYTCDSSPCLVFSLPSVEQDSWRGGIYYNNGTGEIIRGGKREGPLPALPAPPLHAKEQQGKLALFLENGKLVLLSLKSHTTLWEGAVPFYQRGTAVKDSPSRTTMVESRLLFDERGVYYLSRVGAVGFTPTGQRLWQLTLKGASSLPAFSDEGILYAGGTDWILYAYKIEERVRSRTTSLYGSFPEGSYGFAVVSGGGGPFMYPFDTEEAAIQTQLREIQDALQNQSIGEKERDYYEILCFIAEGKVPPGWQPILLSSRIQALSLLGAFASRELIPFLAQLVQKESEHLVIAQALTALGSIGSDPFGYAMGAFRYLLSRPFLYRNEQLAASLANAIYRLCMFSGPPLSVEGVHLLVQLSNQIFSAGLQNTIKTYLADLRKES